MRAARALPGKLGVVRATARLRLAVAVAGVDRGRRLRAPRRPAAAHRASGRGGNLPAPRSRTRRRPGRGARRARPPATKAGPRRRGARRAAKGRRPRP
ncbi:MAG: hypothetical protein M3348_05880, partial [Acidobacteriota bacterium]|nr:hypothetical protein [Acidobacteriota bacterium]